MLRALCGSLLSLLLLATLTWGGCVSCEQYFMLGSSKACCHPGGHCKTKTPAKTNSGRDCQQIAFDHHKNIDLHFDLAVLTAPVIQIPLSRGTASLLYKVPLTDPSPPDLQVLHSIFLI